jgi:hypothetical protein
MLSKTWEKKMARIRELSNRKLSAEFDSVPEVFKVIRKLNWVPQEARESDARGTGGFHTFNSLDECKDIFENHPERIRAFSQNDDKLATIESPGKDVIYDVTGDFLDIDRYLEGIPEVFGNAVMGNPRTLFCTINILGSFVHWTDPAYQMQKQKRVLRLVDWLEQQDIRCQIMITEDSDVLYSSVLVKEFADHFDLNQLAVGMHPDWLRRIIFLIAEQSKTFEYGYGSSLEYDKRMVKYQPNPEDGLYVYVGGYLPYKGNDEVKLNKAFDEIEEGIQEIIDNGLTFNDRPLMVKGEQERW